MVNPTSVSVSPTSLNLHAFTRLSLAGTAFDSVAVGGSGKTPRPRSLNLLRAGLQQVLDFWPLFLTIETGRDGKPGRMWFRVSKPSSKASFLNVKGVMRNFVEHRAQIHSQHICFVQ